MAGVERFELPSDGVRVRSLTAWRYPNKYNHRFPTGTTGKEFFYEETKRFRTCPSQVYIILQCVCDLQVF